MSVTAKDIARELNLSQPTVSRILNGDEGHRAAEETRRRVMEAAERMGYQPNAVARSLRRGRTNIIGVHTFGNYDVRNDFLGTIVGALQCACQAYRLDVLLHSTVHGTSTQAMLAKLRDGRVDGLILHSSNEDPLVEALGSSSLPVVAVADPLNNLPAVTSDDENGMRGLIDLLWLRGHRKFVFLGPEIRLASVERRARAFTAELERRGVRAEDRRVQRIQFEDAEVAVPGLVRNGPLAVCCWNDRTAYKLLSECLRLGIQVPRELAVAGFDGFRDDKLPALNLVTVRCPWEDVARTALEVLVGIIETRETRRDAAPAQMPPREVSLKPIILEGNTA